MPVEDAKRLFGLRPRSRALKMRAVALLRWAKMLSDLEKPREALATFSVAIIASEAYYRSGDVNVSIEG